MVKLGFVSLSVSEIRGTTYDTLTQTWMYGLGVGLLTEVQGICGIFVGHRHGIIQWSLNGRHGIHRLWQGEKRPDTFASEKSGEASNY